MSQTINRLSQLEINNAEVGMHADGGGLYLQVTKTAAGQVNKSWLFRYSVAGRERQMGLGSLTEVKLADVRKVRNRSGIKAEAVARSIEPSGSFGGALRRIENVLGIRPALKKAFRNLYGLTSDEKGIRHPVLDKGRPPRWDEPDVIFIIGAYAAFVSYLIGKTW